MTQTCTGNCLSGDEPEVGVTVCKTCREVYADKDESEQLNFYDGTQCVSTCEQTNVNGFCKKCKEIDGSTPYWVPASQTCVSTCPELTPAHGADAICTTCVKMNPNDPSSLYWKENTCV